MSQILTKLPRTADILDDVRFIAGREIQRMKKRAMDNLPLLERDGVHLRTLVQTLVMVDNEERTSIKQAKLDAMDDSELRRMIAEMVQADPTLLEAAKK